MIRHQHDDLERCEIREISFRFVFNNKSLSQKDIKKIYIKVFSTVNRTQTRQ